MKNISFLLLFLLPVYGFSQIIYVDSSAVSGQNTGIDWANAFTDLQDAINASPAPDEIWVAKGTYYPTDGTDRGIYFELPSNVALLGGFSGVETNSNQRNWDIHKTILSGDIGLPGDTTDNSFTVVYAIDVGSETVLDGFIIEGGNADSELVSDALTGPRKSGGGLYLRGQTESIRMEVNNCIFQNNFGFYYGGGVYLINTYNGSMSTTFSNCKFYNNTGGRGGAIGKYGGGEHGYANKVIDCAFENNSSYEGGAIYILNTYSVNPFYVLNSRFFNNFSSIGGAIRMQHEVADTSAFVVENCVFEENYSEVGGAVYFLNFSFSDYSLQFQRTLFINNNAGNQGGCITSDAVDTDVRDCLFVGNSSNFIGGCIANTGEFGLSSGLTISNSTFFSNWAETSGGVIRAFQSDVEINNSIFLNNTASSGANISEAGSTVQMNNCLTGFDTCEEGVSGNVECNNAMIYNQDPLFIDAANMNFSLSACSPAIDAGDNSYVSGLFDAAGNDRIINGKVDIGAFEAPSTFLTIDMVTPTACFGQNSGSVDFTYHGQPPFVTQWDNGSTMGTGTDSLAAGIYSMTVTDANDCTETIDFEIEEADSMSVSFTTQEVSCPDGIDGSAMVMIQGGIPDYFIAWSSGEYGFEANLLIGGWNEVTVIDGNNCELVDSVFIEQPEMIFAYGDITNASTNNASDGSIEVFNVTGGTPPFQFEWNTGDTTALIDNLPPNSYTVTITDANGCIAIQGFLVSFNTATADLEDPEIVVLPNPVEGGSTIEIEFENATFPLTIDFYDSLGNLVETKEVSNALNHLQIKAPLIAGIYVIIIRQDDQSVKIEKIVIY